jgi:hypothetical protein
MEQKMTMVIRAVRNPCTYYIMARSHKRRLGEGTVAWVEVETTSLLSQTVMMCREESLLNNYPYMKIQLSERRFQL